MILDTPNLSSGVPTAGLPARMYNFALALRRCGAEVSFVLADRGITEEAVQQWPFPGFLVNPSLLYGSPECLNPTIKALEPDLIILTDSRVTALNGPVWAASAGARLIYESHDDEGSLAAALGDSDEAGHRREWQRAAALSADFATVLTAREADMLRSFGIEEDCLLTAPIGIHAGERTEWGPDLKARRLVFIGNLFYEPNARAVRFLRSMVKKMPGVSVRIIGRGPSDLTSYTEAIEFTGAVRDLDPHLSGVSLALAPLDVGSGQKSKLLDYLAAGLPVLGTSESINGLLSGDRGVILEDDLGLWPGKILSLLDHPHLLKEISSSSRSALMAHHNWDDIAHHALCVYRRWIAVRPQVRTVALPEAGARQPSWLVEHAQKLGLGNPRLTFDQPVIAIG